MRSKSVVVGIAVLGALALAGCGSGSSASSTTTSSPSGIGTTTTLSTTVENLHVTPAIREALLAAGAAGHNLPVSDYTGLAPGLTYYAYDPADHLYWAGAQLRASASSMPAQIGLQDDGSYDLFTMPPGGTWTAFNDGLGNLASSTCSVVVPAAVRTVWNWSQTGACGAPVH
jgi:hypothetical protein